MLLPGLFETMIITNKDKAEYRQIIEEKFPERAKWVLDHGIWYDDFVAKITKAVKDQKLSEREQQFIPHAATWLSAKRWEDEVTTIQKPLMGWK